MFKSNRPLLHYITKPAICVLTIFIMLFGLWLTESQATTGTVTGSVVNVRSAPSSSGEVIGTILKDTQVEILGTSGDWCQIKFAKLQGYVARELITASQQVQVTNGPINARSGPGTSFDIVAVLSDKTVFTVLGEKDGWYQIQLPDGHSAYAAGWLVTLLGDNAAGQAKPVISTASTSATSTVTTSSASPSVILNGSKLKFEVEPRIENGRTLVPLRTIFETMGASVEWDETTHTVTARNSNTTVILPLDSTSPTVNGQAYKLEVPAKIVNGRTLAPLRFVGEAFGGKVNWNEQTATITINYTAAPTPAAVTVQENQVNLRDAPSTTATLIDHAANGETMTVLNEKAGWYQVQHGSLTAWVASWLVAAAPAVVKTDPDTTEPAVPVVATPADPVQTEPDNTLHLARTKDASGITVTISSKIKMEPAIAESSGSIQYTFKDRLLSGLNYFDEALGSDMLKVKASSQDNDTVIAITLPGNVKYKKTASEDGKQLTFFIPNYLINIQESAYGSVGERLIISTLTPVTGTGKLNDEGKLEVTLPGLTLNKDAKFSYSSALVSSMTVASSPANSTDLLITLNTIDLYKYSFAASGSNNDLNIILLHKTNSTPRGKIVFLDAGHGGRDTGARGSLADEKDINLAVALKAGALLQQKGIQVAYSRTDDSFVELEEISNMANKINAAISVSIHCNANTSSTPGGTETYFYAPLSNPDLYVQHDDRLRLATLLQTELVKNLQRSNRGVKEGNLSVLRNSQMPSALVELAFISNPDEQALLMSEDFQNLAASAIANAVVQYMNGSADN